MKSYKPLFMVLLCTGCVGDIESTPDVTPQAADASQALRYSTRWSRRHRTAGSPAPGAGGTSAPPVYAAGSPAPAPLPAPTPSPAPTPAPASSETLGTGDITQPAQGPAPIESSKLGGSPFVLVKNWNFGTNGTVKNTSDLVAEFNFHDQWNTIANGSNYGAVTVAANSATAISAPGLGLPNDRQPVEDPAHPTREFTGDTLKAYVRPLSASASSVSVSAHDTGNGSLTGKWTLPSGGAALKRDLLWETRVRIPTPQPAYWFALWTAGTKWDGGAEMDVVESFGTPNIGSGAHAFHVNSVGGADKYRYSAWPSELDNIGVPSAQRDLSQWHTFTWVYLKDDSYKVYYDGYLVQQGTLHWTLTGAAGGENIDMSFLFDFGWGHTQISDVNIALPASSFPLSYEIDYSRVYMR